MRPIVRIRLLGQFELRVGGEVLPPLDSVRAESMLAYLLLHAGDAVFRQQLAFLLWPDSTEAQARTNLRHVLHTLRRGLPDVDRHLEITPRTLRWRLEPPYWLDVAAFEQLLAEDGAVPASGAIATDSATDRRTNALREAVEIYTGDLLEGRYDEWLLGERERLRQRQLDALGELAVLCSARGDLVEAIAHAERLLRGDPLREETYRQLMRCHYARGDRARALRVYHVCSSTLERELGVEPAAETVAAYEALVRRTPAPPPATLVGGPSLVGRGRERARLAAVWRATEAGRAQFVLVTGEAGVGKSRLVDEFRRWCARQGAATADARCYPAEGSLAYAPVVTWLRSAALRPRLRRLDRARLTELARLLPELLAETPDLERPAPLPEGDQRHRLFDAVAGAVLAAGGPLLLVVDDVQHADPASCHLLHYLLRVRPEAPVLVVATARQEDLDASHPMNELLASLHARERLEEIELARLGRDETAVLAERVTGARLPEPDAQRLYDETEGNPLFVVEALGAGWTAGRPLSPRVQSVIEARLAQLSEPARGLVELAATVGREFSTDVLAAASEGSDDVLVRSLDELWRRRIVRERSGAMSGAAYDFSHDKIRQVVYLGISPARRRRLHQRVASALERSHAADPGPVSVQIAAHLDRAGAAEQAVEWYRRAAQAAQLLHANAHAVDLLNRALELLRSQPQSADRDAVELEVCTELLAPLVSVRSYASHEMTDTQQRARHLADALGVDPAPPLLRSLALSALTRSDFRQAAQIGAQLRKAAERDSDEVLVVEAAYVLGIASFWQAELTTARRHFERAVERYRPENHVTHVMRYAQDPKVVCLGRLANTLWFLGEPDAARTARAAAMAWAEQVGHPFSRTVALTFAALLALDMGDEQDVHEYTAALVVEGQETLNLHVAAAFGGYVAVLDGQVEAGIAAIRAAARHTHGGAGAPGQHALVTRVLLAAHEAAHDIPGALAVADELLAMGGPARLWEPVARRVRAKLRPRG